MRNVASQPVHSRSHSRFVAKNGRPSHKNLCPCLGSQRRGFFVHPSVHFHLAAEFHSFDHLTNALNLGQCAAEKVLVSETRINRHHQYVVDLRQNFFEHCRGSCWIDDNPSTFSVFLDPPYCAIQVAVTLPMDQEGIRTCGDKLFQEQVWIGHHQVRFERQPRDSPKPLHDRCSHRGRGNKMSVHHVDMNPIRAGLLRLRYLFPEASEVRCQDGGRQFYNIRFCLHQVRPMREQVCLQFRRSRRTPDNGGGAPPPPTPPGA